MAISVSEQSPQPRARLGPPTPVSEPRRRDGWRRVRRIFASAALLSLVPAGISFVSAMAQASNSSLSIKAVEWLRDNGARGLVNEVESIYYSLTAPAKGGPGLKALPQQPNAAAAGVTRHIVHYYRPHRIAPMITPGLPGEGVWRATFSAGGSRPPVLVTSFRADPSYPRLVAGVAWFDHTRTSTWLYPGRQEPPVTLPRGPMELPTEMRSRVVASFNSGFKLKDSGGGFAVGGHAYAPMQRGVATIIRYRNGSLDIKSWTGGSDVGPNVMYARQNLPLMVNHGRPNPNLSDGPEWGATLGNAIRVWRSAIGIDRRHNLIYAAAPEQTVGSLAAVLIHAGAVRAMELDINSYWTSLITYRFPGAHGAADLLASMSRPPSRYLTTDDRDFFAVYAR
jgi:hypothetical protein